MKFVDGYTLKDGTSIVVIEHKGELFTGNAKLHPEDKDKMSEFTGCRYAEIRATIKALKYERNILKAEAEDCRRMIKACSQDKRWDPKSPTAKVTYRQLNIRIKKVNEITEKINQMMFELNKTIWSDGVVSNALDKYKQKK